MQLPLPFALNPTTNLYESLIPIPSEPGLFAGHLGGIYSTRGGHSPRLLAQHPTGGKRTRGYLTISCYTRREGPPYPRRGIFVHTLIAEAYLGPRPSPTHEIDHIDGDSWNNAAANLQYLTPEEHRTKPTMTDEDWAAIL